MTAQDHPSIDARLQAQEILMREILGFTLGRRAIVDRALLTVGALEREAILSGDQSRRERAAEVRVALDLLTE